MGYIYKIIDTTTHEYYIGKRCNTDPKTDNYWGSGYNRVCRSAKKHKGANGRYRKDILINGVCNEKLGKLEEIIIGDRYETDSLCLNLKAGGMGGAAKGNTNAKGNKGNLGKVVSQASKDKMSAAQKGNTNAKGKVRTAEQNQARSATMMGNTLNLGKVCTAEQNAEKSACMKEWWRLRKLSEST